MLNFFPSSGSFKQNSQAGLPLSSNQPTFSQDRRPSLNQASVGSLGSINSESSSQKIPPSASSIPSNTKSTPKNPSWGSPPFNNPNVSRSGKSSSQSLLLLQGVFWQNILSYISLDLVPLSSWISTVSVEIRSFFSAQNNEQISFQKSSRCFFILQEYKYTTLSTSSIGIWKFDSYHVFTQCLSGQFTEGTILKPEIFGFNVETQSIHLDMPLGLYSLKAWRIILYSNLQLYLANWISSASYKFESHESQYIFITQ